MTPVPILLYHSVGYTTAPDYRRWCVEPSLFGEQLAALGGAGYDFMTVSGLIEALDAGPLPPRPLVVTFDDGRADYVEHAMPRLASAGVPSTMYVVSAHVGTTSSWLGIAGESDAPMMTWHDLDHVAGSGHEIGAHSRTHRELDLLTGPDAEREILGSRRELEDGVGGPVRSFAYPHGYHSPTVVAATRAAGFSSACAVNDRWSWVGEGRYVLSRLIVEGWTTPEQLLDRLARPPVAPRPRSRLLRAGWRGVRRVRHRRSPVVTR